MRYAARMKNFGVDTPNTKTVTRTLCFFVAHSATNSQTVLLEEMESAYHDVLLYLQCQMVKVAVRFSWGSSNCLIEIRVFFRGQGKADPELEDEKWLVKLMFLADITTHLNELNLHLQSIGKTVMCLFEVCKGFASKTECLHTGHPNRHFSLLLNTWRLS